MLALGSTIKDYMASLVCIWCFMIHESVFLAQLCQEMASFFTFLKAAKKLKGTFIFVNQLNICWSNFFKSNQQ